MRKLRNSALAAATAVAVTFGGSAVATAQPADEPQNVNLSSALSAGSSGGSSALGDATEGDQTGTGNDALGEEKVPEETPEWLQIWRDLTSLAGIGTVIGGIIGAVNLFNFVNAQ